MGTESVAAIILSQNSANYLPSCLDGVFDQTRELDDIMLIDRGSTDGIADYVAAIYPKVRILLSRKDPGTARCWSIKQMSIKCSTS